MQNIWWLNTFYISLRHQTISSHWEFCGLYSSKKNYKNEKEREVSF